MIFNFNTCMSVKTKKSETGVNYFCTFTNYNWIKLFEITNFYDGIYKWFDVLKKKDISLTGYVIMPNHLHCIIHLPQISSTLDKVIGNAKRFMAYDIVERLEVLERFDIINILKNAVSEKEKRKNHLHKVFTPSFDGQACYNYPYLQQKLNYIHQNPVKAKLVSLPEDYIHLSAQYYLTGEQGIYPVTHFLYTFGEEPYFEWYKKRNGGGSVST